MTQEDEQQYYDYMGSLWAAQKQEKEDKLCQD